MSDTVPPIPPPFGANTGNPSNPTDTINNITTTNVVQNVGPSEIKDTKIAAYAFKALEGEKVNGTFRRLWSLLNDLENNGVSISQVEESDSDIEEDQRSSNEFLADLNAEFHERALLANQRRYYKRSGRVGSPKKPMDRVTTFKALMAVADEELSVGRANARSVQWVEITMKNIQKLLSITDSDERKHVLDYTHVNLYYVEDQRKNLLNKYNSLKQEFFSFPRNIVKALGRKRIRKEKISSKEVVFTKFDVSTSKTSVEIPSDSESEVVPLTVNEKAETKPSPDSSTKKLFLTLMEEVKGLKEQIQTHSEISPPTSQSGSSRSAKGKSKIWFGTCRHCGFKNHLTEDCYIKDKCYTCGSIDHLTKEHPEQIVVKRTLAKLNAQPSQGSSRKVPIIPKHYIPCKYYGFNDHHSNKYEYYPGCDLYGSIAYETTVCVKETPRRKLRVALQRSTKATVKYSKESGPKVVFGDKSLGDTKGYGSVNCNGITFTKGTIFNQNQEVVLIAPRRRDVYVIDMTSYNEESNAYFFAKASPSIENLNEVKVKELRSDNGTEFKNHKLEEFYDEKGISQNFSSPCTPEQNGVAERRNRTLIEAARTISIIMKRHGKTAYDVFRGRSPDISYFYMFGCPVHIHNHMDHLGKLNEIADDGFFLGYYPVAKAFRDYVSYEGHAELSHTSDLLVLNESEHLESADNLKHDEFQISILNEQTTEASPTPLIPLQITNPLTHQERWSREKHIELVNIIGEPLGGITTRSRIKDFEAASAHECLYVNFLSEIESKKLIEALKEKGWIIV
ncbi:retrovirus-related pol polyprotein from transposon TNT 1-94, partial [Tanacetum coccineum]